MAQDPLRALGRRLRTLITRAKVTLVTWNNTRPFVQTSGLGSETLDKVPLHLPYGMSAYPLPGGDVLLLMNTGSRTHVVALHCDDKSLRITDLQAGEYGFRDQNQTQIVFRHNKLEVTAQNVDIDVLASAGNVNISTPGGLVSINGLTIDSSGNLHSPGNVADNVRSMAADRSIYNAHAHGNVQNGSGFTAVTDDPM